MSHSTSKPTKWHVPSETQISMGIRPAWSESLLSAWRNLGSLASYWAHSEDTDSTAWMSMLIGVFFGRTHHFIGFAALQLIGFLGNQGQVTLIEILILLFLFLQFLLVFNMVISETELSNVMRKHVFGVCDQLSLATVLRFWVYQAQILFFQAANNKGAEQTARMCMLICIFVVLIWHKQVFS